MLLEVIILNDAKLRKDNRIQIPEGKTPFPKQNMKC